MREATTMGMFKKAVKSQSFLRLGLTGPAGTGKTYTALLLATTLAGGKSVAVIDTERGSASKYSDLFEFDVLELETFHPSKYVEAINDAVAGGYGVIVIDSLSHAWSGKGGILEIVQRKGNSFQAWGEVKPIEAALIEAVTGARIHIIATMRSKTEYVVEKDEKSGKSVPRKVGLAPVQRDGLEYEFDVFGELDQENTLTIQKTRCPALTGAMISKPGKPLAETLRAWLTGAPMSTTPVPQPTPAPAPRRFSEPTQDDLDEEDGYLRQMAGADAGDGDEATETIPYTPDEDGEPEPKLETPAVLDTMTRQQFLLATAEMGYSPRRVLELLGVRSLEGLNLAQSFEKIKAIGPTKRSGSSSRTRSIVSPLGATAPAGETVPDLAALGTGTEGRH